MSPLPVQGQELPWTHRTSRFSLFPRTKVLSPMFLPQFSVCNSCCTFYPSTQAASLPPVLQVQWPLLHQPWLARTPAASALKWGCPPPWKQETCVKTNQKSPQKQNTLMFNWVLAIHPDTYEPKWCYRVLGVNVHLRLFVNWKTGWLFY